MNNDSLYTEKLVTCVTNDGRGPSYFSHQIFELNGNEQRQLSDQIKAINFRFRGSSTSYSSNWHTAGDPTLIIILNGAMQIEVRSGQNYTFRAGNLFIARDYLDADIEFNTELHGHRARVIGETPLSALHLKLEKSSTL